MTQKVLKVGSSAAVTIPKKSLKDLGLKIGDEVSIDIDKTGKRVIIEIAKDIAPDKELSDWTNKFIKRYKPALKALKDK